MLTSRDQAPKLLVDLSGNCSARSIGRPISTSKSGRLLNCRYTLICRWGCILLIPILYLCSSSLSSTMGTFFGLAFLVAVASATISPAGQTVVVNGISYYAAPESVSIVAATEDILSSLSSSGDLIPLTVMEDSSSSFTTSTFRSIVGNYTATDDVFNTGFLQGSIFL